MTVTTRHARLGLLVTPQQLVVFRRAAEVSRKSMTDFILDSACRAAEPTLLDNGLFVVTGNQSQVLFDLLDRPEQDIAGLNDLFSRRAPWSNR